MEVVFQGLGLALVFALCNVFLLFAYNIITFNVAHLNVIFSFINVKFPFSKKGKLIFYNN